MKLGLWVWERKNRKVKCHFHHIVWNIQEHTVNVNCHCCVDLDHMAEVVSVRLLKLPPLLCCTLWKEVTVHSPHLSGELRSTCLRVLSLYKLFESVLHGIFFSSPLLVC